MFKEIWWSYWNFWEDYNIKFIFLVLIYSVTTLFSSTINISFWGCHLYYLCFNIHFQLLIITWCLLFYFPVYCLLVLKISIFLTKLKCMTLKWYTSLFKNWTSSEKAKWKTSCFCISAEWHIRDYKFLFIFYQLRYH